MNLRTISADELKDILAAHALWRRRGGEEGSRADLTHANLAGADLRGRDARPCDAAAGVDRAHGEGVPVLPDVRCAAVRRVHGRRDVRRVPVFLRRRARRRLRGRRAMTPAHPPGGPPRER